MLNKKNLIILSILFLLSLFVFFASSIVDARAGGGHSFRSSSSSSSSSSRSYSSSRSSSYSSHSSSSYSSSRSSQHHSYGYTGPKRPLREQLKEILIFIFFPIHYLTILLIFQIFLKNKYTIDDSTYYWLILLVSLITILLEILTCVIFPFLLYYYLKNNALKDKSDNKINYSFNETKNITSITSITSKDPLGSLTVRI